MMLATACAEDSNVERDLRRFEGIYEVQAHAFNAQACSPDGAAPIENADRFVVATVQTSFGEPYLQLASCASPAACRDLVARMGTVSFEYGFTLSRPSGENLVGEGASTGYRAGNVCTLADVSTTTLIGGSNALRIERAITIADDYTARNNICDTESARVAAKGNACSQMETLSATLVEAL